MAFLDLNIDRIAAHGFKFDIRAVTVKRIKSIRVNLSGKITIQITARTIRINR